MDDIKMQIKITAATGGGKSAVGVIIQNALREHGIAAEIVNEDTPKQVIMETMSQRLTAIVAKNISAEIVYEQLPRSVVHQRLDE